MSKTSRVENSGTPRAKCRQHLAWAADNATIFRYDVLDEDLPAVQIFRHTLGGDAKTDRMVFVEPDDHYFVSVSLSRNKRWIFIDLGSKTTSEAYFLDATLPYEDFRVVQRRQDGVEYYVYPHDEQFFIITNDNALNFKVMVTPERKPARLNWQNFCPTVMIPKSRR